VQDRFDDLADAASGAGSLSTFVAILVAVVALALLAFVLPRVRRTATAAGSNVGDVLGDHETSAADFRRRADAALSEERFDEALSDAYRALAKRTVERGAIEQSVGSTAHELAERMARRFPTFAERLVHAADLFDAVVYGRHPARREDVLVVLTLDDELRRARPTEDAELSLSSLVVPR